MRELKTLKRVASMCRNDRHQCQEEQQRERSAAAQDWRPCRLLPLAKKAAPEPFLRLRKLPGE